MRPITDTMPKCLLPIAGRPLIDWAIERLRQAGCTEIVAVVGYLGDMIRRDGLIIIENQNYSDNNILHSLMTAQEFLDGDVMVSYSDIWVEPDIYKKLAQSNSEITIAVDIDWTAYYSNREEHPQSEAELVAFDHASEAHDFGKRLAVAGLDHSAGVGEFLGLWKMTQAGARNFRAVFSELNHSLHADSPFQSAKAWRQSYVTDMFKELVERGGSVRCSFTERGWAELDTNEDVTRLAEIAERQKLHEFVGASRSRSSR